MTPERWLEVVKLFERLEPLTAGERAALLEREAPHPEVRREVDSLLRFAPGDDEVPSVVLDAAASAAGAADDRLDAESFIGRRFGPWRITEKLGEGGMAVVFAAVRDDAAFQKRAAIKLMVRAVLDPVALARFRQERQILAQLEHPNIARLLDGGSDQGMPYLVMELVEGEPLVSFCERRGLGVRERLRMFQSICAAVHYAHRNLVVHRDLKPSNILVADGVPKLLDFGIAKLLDPNPAGTATEANLRLMTPGYAAPEQVRGERISTATDVYALGVILYELLSGACAQVVESTADLVNVVCQVVPPPPSAAAARTSRARARELRGDLDTIVLMALRKEPERRYPSAGELGDDIGRCLGGLPVHAQRDTLLYRTGKLIRRNKLVSAAALLVVLSLAGGLFGTLQMARARAAEARRAEQRLADVRQMAGTFLFEFDDAIAPVAGTTAARELVVRTAKRYLESLAADAGDDRELTAELAVAYEKMGTIQGLPGVPSLGHTDDARASFERALALRARMLEAAPGDRALVRDVVRLHAGLADIERALGHMEAARGHVEQAAAMAAPLAERPGADDLESIAQVENARGELEGDEEHLDKSLAALSAATDLRRRALALAPAHERARVLVRTLLKLGLSHGIRGDYEAELRDVEEAQRLSEEELRRQPDDAKFKRLLLLCYQGLTNVWLTSDAPSLGDHAKGLDSAEKMLALAEEAVRLDPRDKTATADLFRALYRRAMALEHDAPERAVADYERALALTEQLAEGVQRIFYRANLLRLSITPLLHLKRLERAESALAEAAQLATKLVDEADPTSRALEALVEDGAGKLAARRGDAAAARGHFTRAAALLDKALARSPNDLEYRFALAETYAHHAASEEAAGAADACDLRARQLETWTRCPSPAREGAAVVSQVRKATDDLAACGKKR